MDLSSLSTTDLQSPVTWEGLGERVAQIVDDYDDEGALSLSGQLKKLLQRQDLNFTPENLSLLKHWLVLMDYLSLPAQPAEEIINLFQSGMRDALGLDETILLARLETRLWLEPLLGRQEYGEKLLQILKTNGQKIGTLSIGEWIALYNHNYSRPMEFSDLEIKDFLGKNDQAQALAAEERVLILRLLKIHNFLKPFEITAPMAREIEKTGGSESFVSEEQKQARIGQAIAKNMPRQSQVYRGTQDIRDTRSRGARIMAQQIARNGEVAPEAAPSAPQNIMPRPPSQAEIPAAEEAKSPAIPLNKNFVQRPLEMKSQAAPPEITIAMLEAAGQKGDLVEEERLRKIIRQDFNKLSEEVRRYVVNSPFWAE